MWGSQAVRGLLRITDRLTLIILFPPRVERAIIIIIIIIIILLVE